MLTPTTDIRSQITGLVLAGGRGSRMGGVDKGLQDHMGRPLAAHALQRLAPQVGPLMLSANRHLDTYRAMGFPVWPDADDTYAGPLAGTLAGLRHAGTPLLLTVPCDCPRFPEDLAWRLWTSMDSTHADIAMAVTDEAGRLNPQPVFCLMKRSLADSLASFIDAGGRKMEQWTAGHRRAETVFTDVGAFFNANTFDELAQLKGQASPGR